MVLSRDSTNAHSPVVVIVPVADAIHVKRVYPSHVHLAEGSGRLGKDSVAKAEQIRAIQVCRFVSYHGRLERDARERIEEAIDYTGAQMSRSWSVTAFGPFDCVRTGSTRVRVKPFRNLTLGVSLFQLKDEPGEDPEGGGGGSSFQI